MNEGKNHCFCHDFGRGSYVVCCEGCKDSRPSCAERLLNKFKDTTIPNQEGKEGLNSGVGYDCKNPENHKKGTRFVPCESCSQEGKEIDHTKEHLGTPECYEKNKKCVFYSHSPESRGDWRDKSFRPSWEWENRFDDLCKGIELKEEYRGELLRFIHVWVRPEIYSIARTEGIEVGRNQGYNFPPLKDGEITLKFHLEEKDNAYKKGKQERIEEGRKNTLAFYGDEAVVYCQKDIKTIKVFREEEEFVISLPVPNQRN